MKVGLQPELMSRVLGTAFPYGTLVVDKAGNLFGTTLNGGERDWGTVFEMTPSAAGCDRTDLLYQVMG